METKCKKSAQRLLALVLCVAMLLPVFPQSAWALTVPDALSQYVAPVDAKTVLDGIKYTGGATSDALEYDCGNGLTGDGANSAIKIVTGTNADEFEAFCAKLRESHSYAAGWEAVKTDNGNKFCKFVGGDGAYSVYTYYLAHYEETRIIVDTNRDTVQGYNYTAQTDISNEENRVDPLMVQWGLSSSPSGYHIDAGGSTANYRTNRENNGSLIIIRMPDNSLFFHDGGILAQMSDEAAAELLAYCRELTGTTGTSTKMVINTWFVSHAHDDHFEAFTRFIHINHEHFDLKNVVYNIDYHRTVKGTGTTPASKDLNEALEIVSSYYPDARFYKPHTGETFTVAGINFEVMYTHEDRLYPADGKLSFSEDLSTGTNVLDLYGTYRTCAYKENVDGYANGTVSDFNDTSTVLKITFPTKYTGGNKAVTSILYADLNLADEILMNIQPASALNADIIMVPHHGFDSHPELIRDGSNFRAKIYLYMQSFVPIFGADGDRGVTDPGPGYNDDSNYYFSGKLGYGGTKIRTDLLDKFKAMFDISGDAHEKAAGEADDTYRIYWGGSETAIIDLKAVANLDSSAKNPQISACVETREAMNFEYTGWKINQDSAKASDGVFSMQAGNATTSSATGTSQIKFTPVTSSSNIIQEGRYLLMSSKYGHIMSHDATAPFQIPDGNNAGSTTAGSIKYDADGNSENTYYFSGNDVILDHSDRDYAIWNLRQFSQGFSKCDDKPASLTNGGMIGHLNWSNFSGKGEGGELYMGVELQKRTKNYTYASDITYRPSNAYWYSLPKDKGEDYQTLFLCFNTEIAPFKNQWRNSLVTGLDASGNNTLRQWFILEDMFDDTYLLYFKKSDDSVYYVVCCDELGTWGVRKYVTDSTSSAMDKIHDDIDELKIKLYEYKEISGTKNVKVGGYTIYNVDLGTTQDAIRNAIMENLVVSDPDHNNQYIPCNGTESKVGYYHLDSADIDNIKTEIPGTYTVDVLYTPDAGNPVVVGNVSVVVAASISSGTGMVSQNATGAVHVYNTTTNAAQEDYVTIRYNGSTINVTVDMLKDADGNAVSTATADQTLTGLKVVFEGVVYCSNFTLKVGNGTISVDQSEYPEPGSVTAGKVSTTSEEDFKETGVANIELSATAKPIEKGVDLIIIVDLSSSMRYHKTSNEYACGPAYNTNGEKNTLTEADFAAANNTGPAYNDFKTEYLEDHPNASDSDIQAAFDASYDARKVSKVFKEEGEPYTGENWWSFTRMYALEESLKTTIKDLRESGRDVDVAIADFGDINHWDFDNARLDTSIENDQHFLDADGNEAPNLEKEFSNHLNFILGKNDPANFPSQPYHIHKTKWGNDDGDTGTLDSFVYTNVDNDIDYYNIKGTVADGADAFQSVETLTDARMRQIVEMMRIQNGNMLGTNYDLGLETAYRLAYAKQKKNEVNGEDRDIVCIFMSDGVAMQYNFLSGRSQSEAWAQSLIGETDEILNEDSINDKYVLTSNFYDTTVNQNPLLKDMGQKLLQLLKDGNLYMAGSSTQKYGACSATQTDFFTAMKEVGVSCNWELFFKIAYTNYQFAQNHTDANWYNALVLEDHKNEYLSNGEKNPLYLPRNSEFCAKTMYRVIHSLRAPSFKRDAEGKATTEQYTYQTLSDYYYFYNTEGKNWWAEALKGDKDAHYPVPNRKAHDTSDSIINTTNGDVLNNFSTKTGLALDGKDYISGVQGLDVDLYTIGFSLSADNAISYETASKVLENVASGPAYTFGANTTEGLTDVLKAITSTMSKSATGAYYMDTMGPEFDLVTEDYENKDKTQTFKPTIYVKEYALDQSKPIYEDSNKDGTADKIVGYQRASYTVRETIKFEANAFVEIIEGTKVVYEADPDGKVAYSDQVYSVAADGTKTYKDIWDDTTNVIFGRFVKYNGNKADYSNLTEAEQKELAAGTRTEQSYIDEGKIVNGKYKIDLTGDGKGDQTLQPETFFWIIGMIGETEMVLEYQAYLEGSMEGEKDYKKDVYPTNKSAILYYTDYIGNKQSISTVSPEFPWGGIPQISYGYYLVNESGEPILDSDGKLQIMGLVDYANIDMKPDGATEYPKTSVEYAALDNFNISGYELYSPNATYTVVYNETKNNENYNYYTTTDTTKTTYVSINGGELSKTETSGGSTTANTTLDKSQVLFAVVKRDSALVVNKTVEATSNPNKFTLVLEAYTKFGAHGLDSSSILKDVLSDYFVLDPDNETAVKVYTYDCTAMNNGTPTFATTGNELKSAAVTLASSDSSGRKDIIKVTGFDYATNYLKSYGDDLGCKLVVKVSIKTRDGFWGGNNVPTNKAETGIYNPGNDTPVVTFPIPKVNVPIEVEITAENKTYYYGTEGKKGSDLNPTITANSFEVTINNDDTLTPAENWMDDYAEIVWNPDSQKPSNSVDGKTPDDYKFSVTVKPKAPASDDSVGEDVDTNGKQDEDTSYVSILYPVLTFKDSTTAYNVPVEGYEFEAKDYVSTQWVITKPQDVPNSEVIPSVEGEAPELNLDFTPVGNVTNFTTDTKIDVTVTAKYEDVTEGGTQQRTDDITNVVTFKWQDDCDHKVADIYEHQGSDDSHEFWVHVVNILPDTVVIDYGLPVNINVLDNDGLADGSTVIGVKHSNTVPNPSREVSGFGDSATGSFGTISVVDNKLQYSINTMSMDDADVFTYAVWDTATKYYYYSTVTVIPATTIYYEDNFNGLSNINYEVFSYIRGTTEMVDPPADAKWTYDQLGDAQQAEDRPGTTAADSIDADNLYGYDGSYTDMQTFSMGNAHKFTTKQEVNAEGQKVITYGTATFSFSGTGFDVISMTSGKTGTITVAVYDANVYSQNKVDGQPIAASVKTVKTGAVDTYYGYTWSEDADGKLVWSPVKNENSESSDEDTTNKLYQVPVMKVAGLPYGNYTAVITITYNDYFNHGQYGETKQYDFYLDAIRIYDPANDGVNEDGTVNSTIQDAYKADKEGWPEYFELRNMLIKADDFNSTASDDVVPGVVFIDGIPQLKDDTASGHPGLDNVAGKAAIVDYANFGPNNELYLAPGQAVAFNLAMQGKVASVQIAMKSVGGTTEAKCYLVDDETTNVLPESLSTATDLYYDITDFNNSGKAVVIKNESGAILSITNIKVTYEESFTQPDETGLSFNSEDAEDVLYRLNGFVGEEDPGEVINGIIDLKGASLSFEDEILTNLYYTVSGIEATEMGLLTWSNEPESATIDTAEQIFSGAVYIEGAGYYMVQTDSIPAKNLGDTIYMCVYAKTENGIVYSDVTNYSPKQYALSRLEKSQNEEMKALCVAMLNYGAAAQEYFGYKTNDLMNASLTAQQQALVSAYSEDLFAGAVAADASKVGAFAKTDGFAGKSASVSFNSAFAINYYFTASAEVAGDVTFCYWSEADYAKAAVLTADNATGTVTMEQQPSGAYWAQIAHIAAKELDDTFYAAAVYTDANGNTHCTGVIAYSLSSYCMKHANGSMGEIAQATAIYGYHANVYFDMEG